MNKEKLFTIKDVTNLLKQMSSYISTQELVDLNRHDYDKWIRYRDDFIEVSVNSIIPPIEVREAHKSIDNTQRSIAVISLDSHDFQLWKTENNLKHDGLSMKRKFKIGNVTYYCISCVEDLCSLSLDSVTETQYANENKEYEHIKLAIEDYLRN
jgi:hypothetical protein